MGANFKVGDTYPLASRIVVEEINDEGVKVDVTDTIDFSTWSVSCQYRRVANDVLLHNVANPFVVPGGPVLDCSLPANVSATVTPGEEIRVDIRIRDEHGNVRSTETRRFKLDPAVSEVP